MQFLVSGLVSGVISGLGMGGGVILLAILTYITQYTQQSLQTINLLYYVPTAIFSVIVYFKNKEIDYKKAMEIVIWGIFPTIISSIIANMIDTAWLRKIFSIYLIIVGVNFFVKSVFQNKA